MKYTKVIPEECKKTRAVTLRFSTAELERLDKKARAEGMTRSAYLRYKALGRS